MLFLIAGSSGFFNLVIIKYLCYRIFTKNKEVKFMPTAQKVQLEHHLVETFTTLTSSQKREVIDFAKFVATRGRATKPVKRATGSLEALFDIATGCKDADLSTRHDEYLYGDNPL
jgi:hypothetical protein